MSSIKDGQIVIDFDDIKQVYASMTPEDREDFNRLTCMDRTLFGGVYSAMANGYWGDMWEGGWSFDHSVVNKWREKFLPLMPQIAKDLVFGVLLDRDKLKVRHDYYQSLAWWYDMREKGYDMTDRPMPVDPGYGGTDDPETLTDLFHKLVAPYWEGTPLEAVIFGHVPGIGVAEPEASSTNGGEFKDEN